MRLISPTPSNATLLALALAIVPALTSPTPQINSRDTRKHIRRETNEEILGSTSTMTTKVALSAKTLGANGQRSIRAKSASA
jgi:hypothetical protein